MPKDNTYYIKLPRREVVASWPADSHARKYWDLVRKHHGSRMRMLEFIESIGGYQNREVRTAISFSIKDYYSDLSLENLWKLLCSDQMDVGPDKDWKPEHIVIAKSLFSRAFAEHEKQLWDWGVEEAYDGWKDSDVPYETFVGQRINWSWGIYGRCGGHLCLKECEGIDLDCSTEDLIERLTERVTDSMSGLPRYVIPAENVVSLFILCVQLSVDLDARAISAEINYRAAWRLWVSFCEHEMEAAIDLYDQRENLATEAETIYGMLTSRSDMQSDDYNDADRQRLAEAFKNICKLADIKCEE